MPTRYLKPGIRDSAVIDALAPVDEVMFYRLLVTVDDFGRTDARPQMIKAACFPIKDAMTAAKCSASLEALEHAGLIELYQVDGKPYLQLRKWDNTPRAGASKFPQPAHTCAQVHTDADGPRTLLPLTVTETETETGTDKAAARKRTPASFKAAEEPIPDWLSRELWVMWCKDRAARGKPVTKDAMKLQIERLETFMREGQSPKAVIEHSIAGGYQGLFAPTAQRGSGATQPGSVHPNDWRETRRGIEDRARALGMPAWDQDAFEHGQGETFAAFTVRVVKADRALNEQVNPEGVSRVAKAMAGLKVTGGAR